MYFQTSSYILIKHIQYNRFKEILALLLNIKKNLRCIFVQFLDNICQWFYRDLLQIPLLVQNSAKEKKLTSYFSWYACRQNIEIVHVERLPNTDLHVHVAFYPENMLLKTWQGYRIRNFKKLFKKTKKWYVCYLVMNFFTNFQIFFDNIHNFFSQKQYFNFFMAAFDKIKGYID